jgi:glycosyltransferase involved in cell wall biosynthesis
MAVSGFQQLDDRTIPQRVRASIIIRTFNEARYLPELLLSILEQTVPAAEREVIVVDSGSTDETLDIARRHNCRVVTIKQSEFSFGRSLNYGCEVARGEHLIFISGHCVPTTATWLADLLRPFEAHEVMVTYGRQEGGPDTKFSEHMLFAKYFPAASLPPPSDFFCNNANAALRRTAWVRHHFDETLTGLEDMHLARRLVGEGGRVVYVPTASVFHYHHETWRKVKLRYEREAIALQKIMPEVHVNGVDALRYFLAGLLGDLSKALDRRVLLSHAVSIVCFRFCQYYGTWRGNHLHRQLSRQAKEKYFYPR